MTKQFKNKSGEIVDCVEIGTCYPTDSAWEANRKQRQAHADKNNNGELGQAGRFYADRRGIECWVDTEARVWWTEDCR
jgi:hypothetical protein